MTREEKILTIYAEQDKDLRNGSKIAEVIQQEASDKLQELGFYIIANRDNPESPIFHLQRIDDPNDSPLYEVHG